MTDGNHECYAIRNQDGIIASVVTNLTDAGQFHELMHQFMCGTDFTDRSHLTIHHFGQHMRDKGYDCHVYAHDRDYHWWLQDD